MEQWRWQHRHADVNRCALSVETKSRTKKSGRPEIPTRSLCLSSVLVVILQPGCQTVDPGEENAKCAFASAADSEKLQKHVSPN